MPDNMKAFKTLGIDKDLASVMTPVELGNLAKMPIKKATPMLKDAYDKAGKKAKAAAMIKALEDAGIA